MPPRNTLLRLCLHLLLPSACLSQATKPVFIFPNPDGKTVQSVDEGKPAGTTVLTVQLLVAGHIIKSITVTRTADNADVSADFIAVGNNINTQVVLDFETTTAYRFTVEATNNEAPEETATAEFTLSVKDTIDEPPVLSTGNTYTADLPEEQPPGTLVFSSFTVTDKDAGDSFSFSLTGMHVSYFEIDSSNGEIRTLQSMDRDAIGATTVFTITLIVTDKGGNTASQNLQVTLTDINDNSPVCTPPLYYKTVPENSPTDVTVETLSCTDIDAADNGAIATYTITQGDDANSKFKTVGDEVQTTTRALDYETKSSYTLVVEVVDQGTPPKTGTATVVVVVGHVNEHTPVFDPTTYTATVAEDAMAGTILTTVTAKDLDQGGQDGTIRYSIISGNGVSAFTIDASSGQISTTGGGLDRETTNTHTLTVRASDDIPGAATEKSADVTVTITVTDVNDNPPRCSPVSYQASVTEPAGAGVKVVTLTATDDDLAGTPAATLTFDITAGNSPVFFQMVGSDLQLTREVDYEGTRAYSLTVRVSDGGSPSLTSTCRVDVTVLAFNEFPPITTDPNHSITLPETTAIGTTVYDVDAKDKDQGVGSTISYSIASGNTNNDFFCFSTSGEVVVWNALDFDTPPQSYNLTVQTTDDGGLSGSMWLFIQLEDSNDQTPKFSKNTYPVTVTENIANNSVVLTVQALDTDTGDAGVVTYKAVSGNGMALFAVHPGTGDVTTTGNIDREVRSRYSLVVEASDGGTPSLSATALVDITIADENDNAPVFTPPDFTVSVSEDVVIGFTVTTLTAADADSAVSNNVFSYVLNDNHFAVDAAGVVTVIKKLNREARARHVLTVLAPDSGAPPRTGSATVTVIVSDVNDNAPAISGSYNPTVAEDTAPGTIITTITATDRDSGDNARLNYVIVSGNVNSDFVISDVSGIIQVQNSLNRERTASYSLVVEVNDNGSPKLTATTTVTVTISDSNDNAPVWTENSFSFSVLENTNSGQVVGQVTATDKDIGVNAALTFSVVLFWTGSRAHFNLDGSTGVITTATPLDRESTAQYSALLRVTDAGSPQLHADVNVSIAVLDLNDNEPRFDLISYDVTTIENKPAGTGLLIVTVTDDDIGVNADVTLSIDTSTVAGARAAQFFQVTSGTGVVSVRQVIDREVDASFFFTLLATDGGTPSHTSSANVTVTVADVNDNAPVFTNTYYNTEIAYSGLCTRSIVTVSARDADSGLNGQVSYFLDSPSFTNLFQVDATSGEFSIQSGLTANTMYTVNVSARDRGTPTLTATSPALIRVDALVPNDVVVTFKLGITVPALLAQRDTFLQQLQVLVRQTHSTALARLWCAETNSDGLADAHVYFLSDNSTEAVANSNMAKYFIPQSTARAVFTLDAEGNPNSAMSGAEWAPFDVRSVQPYFESQTAWTDTADGIAIIAVATLAGVALLAIATYMTIRYCRHSSNKQIPRQVLVEEKRPPARNNVEPEPAYQKKPLPMSLDDENFFWSRSSHLK